MLTWILVATVGFLFLVCMGYGLQLGRLEARLRQEHMTRAALDYRVDRLATRIGKLDGHPEPANPYPSGFVEMHMHDGTIDRVVFPDEKVKH